MSVTNLFFRALNVPMRALLRSPLHRIGSGNLCLLHYRGRVSGKAYVTPLSYVREGNTVRLLSSYDTHWWKNFVGEARPVEVEIARERLPGRARAIVQDGEQFRNGVRRFLTALPRDAVVYGIKLDADRKPREDNIELASAHVVLIEVELEVD